jgi:hypothetical protein
MAARARNEGNNGFVCIILSIKVNKWVMGKGKNKGKDKGKKAMVTKGMRWAGS